MPHSLTAEDLYHEGLDRLAEGDPAGAAQRLRRCLEMEPGMLDAMHGLIRALQEQKEFDAAIAVAQRLRELDPDEVLAHTSLSILYQHKGLIAEAEAAALQAKLLGWKKQLQQTKPKPARTLYVATTNPGKLRDLAVAAAAGNVVILPLPGLNAIEAPAEDAPTFEDNAREKAIYYSRFLPGEIVLADDSGLEVDALEGAPGVRSARYAADAGFRAADSTDANNNLFLLQQLAGVNDSERGARYRCVLAAARDGACLLSAQGTVEGRILSAPRGSGGFGYDPLFYLPELEHTMAEIDEQSRWSHGHRGQALRSLFNRLSSGPKP